MSEQAEYEKYLGDLYEMEQKYLRERYPEDFVEQDRLYALEDAREDAAPSARDWAKLLLQGIMVGGHKLGFDVGPWWQAAKGSGFALGGLATARRGITTEAGEEMAEKGFQMDRKKADLNDDGQLSSYEEARGMAVQKAMDEPMEMYHGGMPCGCGGDCDGSCGGMMSDPVSGNPIPPGSSAENVRDDIEAMISEGEYVLPANVVKWHGLKHIMEMQEEAEMGLMGMTEMGLIQYAEPTEPDSEGVEDAQVSDEGDPIEEEAEETPEAQDSDEIEVAGVTVEEDGDTEEIYPEEETITMPGMLQKQKIAFIV
jgi:hypothetical protein